MVEKVFAPTRVEPFFEKLDEAEQINPAKVLKKDDIENFRLTVRWHTYLDSLGQNVNLTDNNLEFEISGLETEIRQVQSFLPGINARIDELEDEGFVFTQLVARIHSLEQKVKDLEALV